MDRRRRLRGSRAPRVPRRRPSPAGSQTTKDKPAPTVSRTRRALLRGAVVVLAVGDHITSIWRNVKPAPPASPVVTPPPATVVAVTARDTVVIAETVVVKRTGGDADLRVVRPGDSAPADAAGPVV